MRKSLSMYIFQYLFLLDIFLQLEEKMLKSFHNYLFPCNSGTLGFLPRLYWDRIFSNAGDSQTDNVSPVCHFVKNVSFSNFLAKVVF